MFLPDFSGRQVAVTFLCLRRGVSVRICLPRMAARAFLCLRRGVSAVTDAAKDVCPLFSAYAEVFPLRHLSKEERKTFLCLRRGVS